MSVRVTSRTTSPAPKDESTTTARSSGEQLDRRDCTISARCIPVFCICSGLGLCYRLSRSLRGRNSPITGSSMPSIGRFSLQARAISHQRYVITCLFSVVPPWTNNITQTGINYSTAFVVSLIFNKVSRRIHPDATMYWQDANAK